MKKRKAWNSGLTKETDDRVKRIGEKLKDRIKNGEVIPWQKGQTKETNESVKLQSELISKTINKKIKNGLWHTSFAKRRTFKYNGINFQGSWEVEFAKYLDNKNKKWRKPKESFSYLFNGKEKRYTPDFYIEDEQCYYEIKGYVTEKDIAKWEQFPLRLKIITGEDLLKLNLISDYRKQNLKFNKEYNF